MRRGFEELPRPVEVSRSSIDRHITSTLEIGRDGIFMLLSNRHQFLSLCTELKKFYIAVSLSFEVALMSVPASI